MSAKPETARLWLLRTRGMTHEEREHALEARDAETRRMAMEECAAILCPGCASRFPLDSEGQHLESYRIQLPNGNVMHTHACRAAALHAATQPARQTGEG